MERVVVGDSAATTQARIVNIEQPVRLSDHVVSGVLQPTHVTVEKTARTGYGNRV